MQTNFQEMSVTELNVGNIVHFYGARFEIQSAAMYPEFDNTPGAGPVMVAIGKWLDGATVNGYFGPEKDWNFQGNQFARVRVEVHA
jgi:hypothetical protein